MSTSSPDAAGAAAAPAPRGRWARWLDRRIPPRRRQTLGQRSIFILPTRAGLGFAVLLLLLLVGAINYQNSMMYAQAFLLGSLFVVAILHTFRNLAGVTVEALGSDPVFAGEEAACRIRLECDPGRVAEALVLGWPPGRPVGAVVVGGEPLERVLHVPTATRGLQRPGRLRIATTWPLGLLQAWSWIDVDLTLLVWPRPLFGALPPADARFDGDGTARVPGGGDEFDGTRDYQPGDPLRRIAWKVLARRDELMTRVFAGTADPRLWFDFAALDDDVETRLSRLAGWVVTAERMGIDYGLRLPGCTLDPARGPVQREAALRALALHPGAVA